jgi:hypothetical protein
MKTQTAGDLVIFGIFLVFLGLIGHWTHPERAYTALISGGAFGALWMLWGVVSAKGVRRTWPAALVTTVLLALTCLWRASVHWLAVVHGQSDRAFTSLVFTLMLAVSAVLLVLLLKDPAH